MNVFRRRLWRVLWALCLLCSGAPLAAAQNELPDEFAPYRVCLWVAIEPSPQHSAGLAQSLIVELAERSERVFEAAAKIVSEPIPDSLARQAADQSSDLSVKQLLSVAPKLCEDYDKLIVISVRLQNGICQVTAREFDCRAQVWGEAFQRDAAQPQNLASAALAALGAAFTPVVRIERVEGDQAVCQLRAGGLLNSERSVAAIRVGDVLQPVLRRNDRQGKPAADGIQRLTYTFLQVTKCEGALVEGKVYSASRSPLASRSARLEKLAFLVRPKNAGMRIVLQSRATPPVALANYEVLTRPAGSDADLTPVGRTDSTGAIDLPASSERIVLVYVKHGLQMLARVPLSPGSQPVATIVLTDDDPRLEAEGLFLALQNSLLDTIARRQMLAARIRQRIEQKDYDGADKLLAELRKAGSREELRKQIDGDQTTLRERLGEGGAPDQRAALAKVDKLFAELYKLLNTHIDSELPEDLASELKLARSGN